MELLIERSIIEVMATTKKKRSKKNTTKPQVTIVENIPEVEENIIDKSIKDVLIPNAVEYYLDIICHRAIPDGRDGLCDIQRRIVWAEFENNYDYRKPHIKSAKVVGIVTGDYHPHGDASAYLTSAFLSQNWKNEVPLVEFHGSNGTISGASPAASRYCITGSSYVRGAEGRLKRIVNYIPSMNDPDEMIEFDLSKTDTYAKDYKNRNRKVDKWFNSGEHETTEILFDNGLKIEGTDNHPLLVFDDKTFSYKWKEIRNITTDDKILYLCEYDETELFPSHVDIKDLNLRQYKDAIIYAWVLSSNLVNYKSGKIRFMHTDRNKLYEFREILKEFLLERIMYKNELEYSLTSINSKMDRGELKYEFYVKNFKFIEYLKSKIGEDIKEKHIPYGFMTNRIDFQKIFLSTYFDLKLTVNEEVSYKNAIYLSIYNTSRELCEQLQIMLLNFGVNNYISDNGHQYKGNILRVSGLYDIKKLYERIGINNLYKYNILKNLFEYGDIDPIRLCNSKYYKFKIKDFLIKSGYVVEPDKLKNIFIDTIYSLKVNFNKIKPYLTEDGIKMVYNIVGNLKKYCIARPVKFTKKKNVVYSLRMDSVDHSFIANGLIHHNTEQRLTKECCELMTNELKNDCVDMKLNYNQDKKEPVILPAKIPLLLINGSFGIAAGYRSSIPTHNPREVLIELINKLKDDNYEISLLPDFPTGGIICNTNDVKEAYKHLTDVKYDKKQKIVVRSKIDCDEKKNIIRITEIPYMLSAESIIENIKKAIKPPEKKKGSAKAIGASDVPKITGINNIKNLTAKGQLNITIECKRGADLETIKSQLYRYTTCQSTIPLKFNYCIGEKFITNTESITTYIEEFIEFRRDTIKRIKNNIIRTKQFRVHIIDGLLVILREDVVEECVAKIRKCKSKAEVSQMLMDDYELDNIQADKVAEYKLYQLAGFAIDELKEERVKLEGEIEAELEYIKDPHKINNLMIDEYEDILNRIFTEKRYPRRTRLENINTSEVVIESIPDQDFVMIFTKKGYIKKLEMIKSQKRNTKGVSVGKLKDDDYVIGTTVLNSRDNILIFTNTGKVYKYKVYEIPVSTTAKLGYYLAKDINSEGIVNIIPVKDDEFNNENIGLVSTTKFNKIKITLLNEYSNVRQNGIISMQVDEKSKDEVISVEKVDYKKDDSIIALNSSGNAIRVKLSNIPNNKRTTFGSNLFASLIVSQGHIVKSVAVVNEDTAYYLYISKNGLGKLMEKSEFEPQYRGTKGKLAAKLKPGDSGEKLIPVNRNNSIIVVSNKNLMKVNASDIPISKRPAFGNIIKKCTKDESIIDIAIDKSTYTE